jgi:hypothetical protein
MLLNIYVFIHQWKFALVLIILTSLTAHFLMKIVNK